MSNRGIFLKYRHERLLNIISLKSLKPKSLKKNNPSLYTKKETTHVRIIIAGAGFAGIAAAKILGKALRHNKTIEVLLFDKNTYTTILPDLPDVVGEALPAEALITDIQKIIPANVRFINEEVEQINLTAKTLFANKTEYSYDYLLISAGSATNFFGFNQNTERIYTLESYKDALRVHHEFLKYLENKNSLNVVVAGAGYTGIELASQLRQAVKNRAKSTNITLVEKSMDIMPFLPQELRSHVKKHLTRNNLRLLTSTSIENFDGNNVRLSTGEEIRDVFLCWATGSKQAIEQIEGDFPALKDGRIIADPYLRIPKHSNAFVAGDTAAIQHHGDYLRKAVNFSICSGRCAASNILNSIKGRQLKEFKPVDLGWILPLGTTSVGLIMGTVKVKGYIGMRLHYMMSGFRNYSFKNSIKDYKRALNIG